MGANATTLPLADRPLARRGVRGRLTGVRVTLGEPAVLARVALATIVLCTALTVIAAAGRPSFLSAPTRLNYFPGWMAGPFGGLWTGIAGNSALKTLFSGSLVLSFGAYALLVGRARHLSVRSVVAAILVAHLFLLVSPPLALTDVFNYLNYARMEVVHHLNPYVTIPVLEPHTDAAYALSNWHGLLSPYGPLFTIFTFAFAKLTVAGYLWTFKAVLLMADLAILALTWRCARLLGRDPRTAVVVVGLNPVVLIWGLGADHNDFLTLLFVMLGVYWMLLGGRAGKGEHAAASAGNPAGAPARAHAARPVPARAAAAARGLIMASPLDLAAGASFVVAAGFKASAGVVIPVALASLARQRDRVVPMLTGIALAAVPVGLATVAAFGLHFPNITIQNTLIIALSLPNLLGLALGQGGETGALHTLVTLALVASIAASCVLAWRRREALAGAGWATLAIIVSLSWVLPWYVLWVLPFAALAGSQRLRRATLVLGAYLIFAWAPLTSQVLTKAGFHPQRTTVGRQNERAVKALLAP